MAIGLFATELQYSVLNKLLTQMRNSGITDNLVMGLLVNPTVATGARAKNILILLASSGIVEKAMNAEKQESEEKEIIQQQRKKK